MATLVFESVHSPLRQGLHGLRMDAVMKLVRLKHGVNDRPPMDADFSNPMQHIEPINGRCMRPSRSGLSFAVVFN